ncbi:histidine phosphatase family protein [Anaerofilum sp. BX8]|uniref:Histidine phosphatase family protein n=1 Tax=Anaerofilum hominis TaxID=2763016 RepID=A0A923L1A9_9FIRM|nr:histidine phosphatase family protein [Anaerofilum hominis]MBC5580958.1 histidine phosphatase family protein [Anaerofilum hominis]
MKTFKLYLLRHGLTEANFNGVYAGSGTDLPLSDEGAAQLDRLREDFEYPRAGLVFVSPLLRARQSADILYPGVRQIGIEDLREIHFGEFEGKTVEQLQQDPVYHRWLDPAQQLTPPGGESGAAFAQRAGGVLEKLCEYMVRSDTPEAAVVTHGGLIMTALAMHAVPRRAPQQWACDPGCGFAVQTSAASLMRDGTVEALEIIPYGYGDYCAGQTGE